LELPDKLKYTESHEWIADNGDGTVTVGITAVAAEQLGDLVYVELPKVGTRIARAANCAVVESTKAASDVYSPISGSVIEGNQAVADDPALINNDPEGAGWFFKIEVTDPSELEGLMDESAYREWVSQKLGRPGGIIEPGQGNRREHGGQTKLEA
jgi:glycine cleavage system H protein